MRRQPAAPPAASLAGSRRLQAREQQSRPRRRVHDPDVALDPGGSSPADAQPHTVSAKARAIGHVNETGKLKDYDVVIDVELKGDARVVGPAGLIHGEPMSTLQKMRIVYTGLDPHSYQPERALHRAHRRGQPERAAGWPL